MNRTRLIFIGILALALGAFASALAYRSLQQHSGPAGGLHEVLVAATDIPVGTKIEAKDIRVVRLPVEALPPRGFMHRDKVIGRGAILPISQGEFFISGKNLASENAGSGLPSMIPNGMRAVSVRVNDSSSVGGFVQPGTRVDVLMTGNAGSGEAQTVTVLRNVAVLANGTALDRNTAGAESQNSPVITLLVSPDDAEKLALAMAQGRIQLTLRNPLDTSQADVAAVNIHSLFPGQKPTTPAPLKRVKVKAAPVAQNPPPPSAYGVEVIKGDKRDLTKVED